MSDAGFASPVTMPRQNAEMAQYGDDRRLLVTFYLEPVLQEFESEKQGRQIYKDETFIHILTPGAKTDIRRKVKLDERDAQPFPPDDARFPRQWAAFQNKQDQATVGTPLEQWPPIGKAQVLEFKALKIHTVEQLAGIADSALHGFGMNGRRLRDLAVAYLDKAQEGAAMSALMAERDNLKADVEALKAQFAELAASTKRGSGRPPKEN